MPENTNLVTTKELATFLNCSESLINKLKRQGEIPFIKIGNSLKFQKEEVLKVLKENTKDTY